jgi:hypothetical protein
MDGPVARRCGGIGDRAPSPRMWRSLVTTTNADEDWRRDAFEVLVLLLKPAFGVMNLNRLTSG